MPRKSRCLVSFNVFAISASQCIAYPRPSPQPWTTCLLPSFNPLSQYSVWSTDSSISAYATRSRLTTSSPAGWATTTIQPVIQSWDGTHTTEHELRCSVYNKGKINDGGNTEVRRQQTWIPVSMIHYGYEYTVVSLICARFHLSICTDPNPNTTRCNVEG